MSFGNEVVTVGKNVLVGNGVHELNYLQIQFELSIAMVPPEPVVPLDQHCVEYEELKINLCYLKKKKKLSFVFYDSVTDINKSCQRQFTGFASQAMLDLQLLSAHYNHRNSRNC